MRVPSMVSCSSCYLCLATTACLCDTSFSPQCSFRTRCRRRRYLMLQKSRIFRPDFRTACSSLFDWHTPNEYSEIIRLFLSTNPKRYCPSMAANPLNVDCHNRAILMTTTEYCTLPQSTLSLRQGLLPRTVAAVFYLISNKPSSHNLDIF